MPHSVLAIIRLLQGGITMWFTKEEILWIMQHQKTLTIRSFRSNGTMPIKIGSKTWLKTGSYTSKERYGQIRIVSAEVKPLKAMSLEDARNGGYDSVQAYIDDQLSTYNSDCDLNTEMIFYRFEVITIDEDLIKTLQN